MILKTNTRLINLNLVRNIIIGKTSLTFEFGLGDFYELVIGSDPKEIVKQILEMADCPIVEIK